MLGEKEEDGKTSAYGEPDRDGVLIKKAPPTRSLAVQPRDYEDTQKDIRQTSGDRGITSLDILDPGQRGKSSATGNIRGAPSHKLRYMTQNMRACTRRR